jgi:hypothetical protein
VEQALASNTTLEIGYVGNRGIHLTSSYDINSIAPQNFLTATFADSNVVNSYRPYQASCPQGTAGCNFGTLTYWDHSGASNYNGFQVLLRSRISSVFQLGAAYTWSHALSDIVIDDSGGGIGGQSRTYYLDPRLDYGNSDVNRPNMFVGNFTWFLPKLQGANMLEKAMLGGWETTGIVTAQDGNNFTITQGAHENTSNLATDPTTGAPFTSQLNQSGALVQTGFTTPLRPLATGQSCVSGRTNNTIINPGAFTLIGYQLGTLAPNMAPRGICGGPNLNNTDFSVHKNWYVKEKLQVKFQLDFFNLFNHPNFNPSSLSQGSPIESENCGPSFTDATTHNTAYNPCSATNNVITHQDLTPGFGTSSGLIGNARQIQYQLHFNF